MAKTRITTVLASGNLLPDRQVADRYGISTRTLYRWDEQPKLSFPKPIRINRRKFRRIRQLEQWERQRAADKAGEGDKHRRAEVTIGQT
jgi:predicted DNA-binding transcriptional regulator AlpA